MVIIMNKIQKNILYFICISTLAITIYYFGFYIRSHFIDFIKLILVDLLVVLNELFLYESSKKNIVISDLIIMALALTLVFQRDDYVFIIYIYLAMLQLIRVSRISFAISLILSMGAYLIVFQSYDYNKLWFGFTKYIIILLCGTILIVLIDTILRQSRELEKTKKRILEEYLKNQSSYEQLNEAYKNLENYTLLKERNRIAREMHDNVGHSLTMSLVELENYALDNVPEGKRDEYNKITARIRKALHDLRTTVHKMRDSASYLNEIDKLIENLKMDNIVAINYSRDDIKNIKEEIYKCLYNIIQESITNGIKHGNAKAFIIVIREQSNNIVLRIINNGKGCTAYKKGFGMKSMEGRLHALGGTLNIDTAVDEGFTVTAKVPKEGKAS